MRGQVGAAGLRKAAQPTECMSPRHSGRVCARALIVSASRHLTLTAAYLLIAALLLRAVAGFDWRGVAVTLTSYLAIAGLVLVGLNRHGGQPRFGAANAMTLMRAAVAALFVGVLDDAKLTETLASNCDVRWTLTGFAAAGLLSDGAGRLAGTTHRNCQNCQRVGLLASSLLASIGGKEDRPEYPKSGRDQSKPSRMAVCFRGCHLLPCAQAVTCVTDPEQPSRSPRRRGRAV